MTVSRRGFLRGVAAGTLAAGSAEASSTRHFSGHPDSKGLLHDATLCVGCRSCEHACAKVNDNPAPAAPIDDKAIFDSRRRNDDELYTVVNRYREATEEQPAVYRKHQCMHCAEPCCASVCFVKAFVKTPEGPVLYNPDLCVGCRYCVFACPYYALSYEYDEPLTPRVGRCTMCYPLIKEGKTPACAEACPNGAIVYGERDELIEVARQRIRKFPGRYINHIYGEHEYGGTSWLTISGLPLSEVDLPENATHDPLPNLTTGFLSLAPLVAAIFPGLLAGMYAFTRRREINDAEARRELLAAESTRHSGELKESLDAVTTQAERDVSNSFERGRRTGKREGLSEAAAKARAKAKAKAEAEAPAPPVAPEPPKEEGT